MILSTIGKAMSLKRIPCFIALFILCYMTPSQAALSVDHSRLIINEGDKSVSITVHNQNDHAPYLAQVWLEDVTGMKVSQPLVAIPPIQRIEAGSKTSVRVQDINSKTQLPSDRESLFYFNLREIPPKNAKKNSLQLALQTRLKVIYRPKQLKIADEAVTIPGVEKLTIQKEAGRYLITNPTPYFITVVSARKNKLGQNIDKFEPLLLPPMKTETVNWNVDAFNNST
ncbi:TPA: fimbria/pilus periplasmic chaperone, partial [Klebsiella pneumoniae]|nr:fimbria/pilus periplasmic chaperone [Klebsiella pneumoniae]